MLSTFPSLLPFLLFAFVASITPGPTNILVLSNSARYGFKATLPIIFGTCASAAAIALLVGYGLGEPLKQISLLQYAHAVARCYLVELPGLADLPFCD
jgi:threonine/homoserine/homoserine lactone efflux protein